MRSTILSGSTRRRGALLAAVPSRSGNTMRLQWLPLTLLAVIVPVSAPAQSADASPDCTYARCALNVVPAWNGLAVVRGADEERLALLGFFKAGQIRQAFTGDVEAVALADRAVATRRVAAFLTDVGGLLLVAGGAVLMSDDRITTTSGVLLGVGAASLGVSVPLQYAADGHLSRAIWRYNRRFATP